MAESNTRKVRRVKKDIISELPGNVQETILCFLPIQDAVRTSILSRKWRHCWTMIPHLIFGDQFLFSIWDKLSQYDDPEIKAHKFVSVINKALLLHNGPILKFSLTFHPECDAQVIHDYIDQWIPIFSRKGIKQLTLEDYELREFTAHHFSSLHLTHLRFARVWFPSTTAFGGFPYLTNLELIQATIGFEQSILDFPVLEKLTLIFCDGLFPTNFRAPNLKCLYQMCRDITLEYSLAGLENLTEYSHLLIQDQIVQTKTSNVVKVLGSLQKVEKFSIGITFIKYLAAGGSPNRLSNPLRYLRTLNICDIDFTELSEVSCLLCLIRSSPNLCKLHISAVSQAVEENLKNYLIEDSEDCTINHLEIVTFSYFRGLKAELELVKFLLAHSPLLKTMFIHRWGIEGGAAFTMAEEMLQYSRASSRAQVRHLKHHLDYFDEFEDSFFQLLPPSLIGN